MDGCGLAPANDENAVAAPSIPSLIACTRSILTPRSVHRARTWSSRRPDGQLRGGSPQHRCRSHRVPGAFAHQQCFKDGSLDKNEVFVKAMDDVKASGKTLHLMGLVTPGGVHSTWPTSRLSLRWLPSAVSRAFGVHAFMDGATLTRRAVRATCDEFSAFLATSPRRTVAMLALPPSRAVIRPWTAIIAGSASSAPTTSSSTRSMLMPAPMLVSRPLLRGRRAATSSSSLWLQQRGRIRGRRGHLLQLPRPDRARQMTRVFTDEEFDGFTREDAPTFSHFVTMTEYDPTFNVEVAFPKTFPRTFWPTLSPRMA